MRAVENERLDYLERALAAAGLKVAEVAPLIADLLQLPAGERYPASTLTAEQKRRRLLAALSQWVSGAARLQPLAMVVEDLHWLDASTLELLQLLAEQGATAPLMLLYSARPEFHAAWPMHTHHSQITLSRLSSRNVREMVASVAARNALASESVEAVVERTGGVPLFVEELTRAVLESGSGRIAGREIPATFHDSLMARLDRLGPAKEVLQIGSVIGSEFSYGLLQAVHPIPDEELQGAIRSATDAELVYVRGIPPDAAYQFKHALIRDAAYEALLRSRRKELHSRVAEVLVEQFPDRITSAPELLAHHYTEAGLIEQAIPYWEQAGRKAIERSANTEAITHLTRGLELLDTLPGEHVQEELTMQVTLGSAVVAAKGYAAQEIEQIYTRARLLCRELGETPHLYPPLLGLWAFYLCRAQHRTALELGEEILRLAQRQNEPKALLLGHYAVGESLAWLGELPSAQEHLEQGMALFGPTEPPPASTIYYQDHWLDCFSRDALVLWLLGYPHQSLARCDEVLTLAKSRRHPFGLASTLGWVTGVYQYCRDVQRTRELAEMNISLCTEHEFPIWLAHGTILHGWALVMLGEGEEGIAQMRRGLADSRHLNLEIGRPYWLAPLAEVYGKVGQAEEGLSLVAMGLALADKTEEHLQEAELFRVKGELTLRRSGFRDSQSETQQEAEACFQKASEIARRQQAKSLELRAVMSLSLLRQHQGRRGEARAMLAEIYGWFTEGFDTADLKDAKALLDELSG
jgi:predicted ATPase